jgi:hypothetical protein
MINKNIIISDETVKSILLKTKGYQFLMLQKGYLEVCIIYHGKIVQLISIDSTNINKETIFSTLKILLKHYLDIEKETIKINWNDLSYIHFYEMSVSSDIGIPVSFYNKMPLLLSTGIETEYSLSNIFYMKLKSDTRVLMHGSYEMAAYNPISNVSHSVQKTAIIDIVYPQEAEIVYDFEGQNLKFNLFRLSPARKKGIRIYVNNLVTIFNDENNVLKNHCPTCMHYKPVNQSFNYAANYHNSFDLKNVGLKYSQTTFHCENNKNTIPTEQWLTISKSEDSEFG